MEEQKQKNTTLTVSVDLWKYLNDHRISPQHTIEDVIWSFIAKEEENGNPLHN